MSLAVKLRDRYVQCVLTVWLLIWSKGNFSLLLKMGVFPENAALKQNLYSVGKETTFL